MRDASVRVLTSSAAALLAYVVVSAVASMELWARLVVAALAAITWWLSASRLARKSEPQTVSSIASGINATNVDIDGITLREVSRPGQIASDITATGNVSIKNIQDAGAAQ